MLNLRYYFRLFLAFIKKFKAIILIGVLFGIVIFFISQVIFPRINLAKTKRTGIAGRYTTSDLPEEILNLISSGLTSLDESGMVVPSLAKSWESPDGGKTWIFTLDEDINWQDGGNLASSDVLYEFSDVEIDRPDDKTITFKLNDPFSPFPSVVSKPIFKKGLLGTGEWEVSKLTISGTTVQQIILVNENKAKKIFKFYPSEERTKLAMKLGEVDEIVDIFLPSPFDTWDTVTTESSKNSNRIVLIFFNTKDAILSDKSIRQALIYSINKETLDGSRAKSSIRYDTWAHNPQVKTYLYNTERAEKLLEDLPDEVKNNLNIKLVTNPILLPVAEKISSYWKGIGVDTLVQVTSTIPSDFQAYLTVLDIPKDPDQYTLWHSTQESTNISKYSSPRIDKLLEDGRSELNIEDRKKIYLDFQRFLVEDSPAAFLYHPTTYTIKRK